MRVNFRTDKSAIKTDSQSIISELYKILDQNPGLNITIEGHTDSEGNKSSNQTLSEQCAASVKATLTNKGSATDRISREQAIQRKMEKLKTDGHKLRNNNATDVLSY